MDPAKFMSDLKEHLPEDKWALLPELVATIGAAFQVKEVKSMRSQPVYKFIPPFNAEVVEWQFDNWQPRSGDVLVATYPKTGTTWTREIVRQLLHRGDARVLAASKLADNPFLGFFEAGSPTAFEIIDAMPMKRRAFGSHLPAELVNLDSYLSCGMKVVYVIRNPKDMIISMKKFFEGMPWMQEPEVKQYFPSDVDGFVRMMVEGKMPMQMKAGEWYPHHIRSWMKYRNHPNFHFVFYEDMKRDPKKEITRLAAHIGVTRTEAEIEDVVKVTSFDHMKAARGPEGVVKMFRKGGVGNWKDHFTDEQSELVDEMTKKDLGDLDIQFTYEL